MLAERAGKQGPAASHAELSVGAAVIIRIVVVEADAFDDPRILDTRLRLFWLRPSLRDHGLGVCVPPRSMSTNRSVRILIRQDPEERNNLANEPGYTGRLAEMKEELKKHLQHLPGRFGEFKD